MRRFRDVPFEQLDGFDEWAEHLHSLLNGPCRIWKEPDGSLIVIDVKALVDVLGALRIRINSNEHPPPHFHVTCGSANASFAIEDCSVLKGDERFAPSDLDKIRYWHRAAKPVLIQKWNDTRPTDCKVGPYRGR